MTHKTEEDSFQEREIDLIPEDWKVVRLRDVAEVKYGKAKPKTKGNIPVVGSSGIYDWTDKPLIKFPTIVIGRKGTAGAVHLFLNPCHPSDTTFYLKFIRNVPDLTYLFYYMRLDKLSGEHAKTTLPSLQKGDLEDYKFPYPPLPEQQKIAKVLGTIRRAIEQQDKIIKAAKNFKKSLMQKLFTEGLEHAEFKETEIGEIPASWEAVKLVDVVDFSRKPRDLNLDSFEKIPFITMEMVPVEKTYVNAYVLKEPDRISSGVYCEKGDILLPKITPCFENGKQGIIENMPLDFAFATTEVYPIKPKNNQLDKMFLFYFLAKSDVRKRIAGKMQGTTGRRRVPKDVVKNALIPLPQIPEQREIARILSTVDKKIEAEERKKATLNELFKTMLHKLMTAEIRLKDIEV